MNENADLPASTVSSEIAFLVARRGFNVRPDPRRRSRRVLGSCFVQDPVSAGAFRRIKSLAVAMGSP